MFLIGVRLFLRIDEIMDLGLFSVTEENTIHNNDGTIAGLFVQMLDKTEIKKLAPVTMILWAMPTNPWSFTVKHLLLIMRIVGHNSGYFSINKETRICFSTSTNDANVRG